MNKYAKLLLMGLVLIIKPAFAGTYKFTPSTLEITNNKSCDIHVRWHYGKNAMMLPAEGMDILRNSTGKFIIQQTGGGEWATSQITFVATCKGDPKEVASIHLEVETKGVVTDSLDELYTVNYAKNIAPWWGTTSIKKLTLNNEELCSLGWRNYKKMCTASEFKVELGD